MASARNDYPAWPTKAAPSGLPFIRVSMKPTQISVSGQRLAAGNGAGNSGADGVSLDGPGGGGVDAKSFAPIREILGGVGGESPGHEARGSGARSLYIHVPFCFHKCHYCDFYSFVDKGDQQGVYVEALVKELRMVAGLVDVGGQEHGHAAHGEPVAPPSECGLRTIFVGGGTPSLLRVDLWRALLDELDALFGVRALSRVGKLEFTVECNPETVSEELMAVLASGGVNRVSIGAQSFNAAHLKTLERWHDPANVERAVRLARDAGIARRSIDLIFGVPGETAGQWREDLGRALAIADDPASGLEHLSCYNLTYEPNTAMTQRLKRGEFVPAPEELEIEMFRTTRDMLRDRGFEAYEVSNFARGEAARCRHNLAYWRQEQWLAAGPSASGHVRGWRWKNTPNLGAWMRSVNETGGISAALDVEPPDARRALSEHLMTGLRLSEGVGVEAMLARAAALGESTRNGLRGAADRVIRKGLLHESAGIWTLTELGVLVGDSVAAEMMSGLR